MNERFLFSVVIDHAGNRKASTGKFECVYRQPMTSPVQNCNNNSNNLVINGVAIPTNFRKENEKNEAVNIECTRTENLQNIQNIEDLTETELNGNICTPPVLNLLQKLDSLFELAVMKKSDKNVPLIANQSKKRTPYVMKTYSEDKRNNNDRMGITPEDQDTHTHKDKAHRIQVGAKVTTKPQCNKYYLEMNPNNAANTLETQTGLGWMTESDCDDDFSVNRNEETCAYMTYMDSDDHLDINSNKGACTYDTQTDSSLMIDHENDGFGYYNLNVDRDKKITFELTQTESNPKIKSTDDNHVHVIPNKKKPCKRQLEPNATTDSDNGNYKIDKEIYPYIAQTHAITNSDYGDHLDVTEW